MKRPTPRISLRRATILSICLVILNSFFRSTLLSNISNSLLQMSDTMPTGCMLNGKNVIEMRYESFNGAGTYSFFVSLHDPDVDRVISRGAYVSRSNYASVSEMHSICEHANQSYTIHCGPGRVFVEVGSALGMVSLYAASRGMRVYAFDPLPPNIQRLDESVCLNGERQCRQLAGADSRKRIRCSRPSDVWGAFAPDKFSRYQALVGASTNDIGQVVESEPGNMAATMRGGGSVRAHAKVVTIHNIVRDSGIELLLLTCQGFEYEALLGAQELLKAGRIRNIVWRRHHMNPELDAKAEKIMRLLMDGGYQFYNIEGSRRSSAIPPRLIPQEKVIALFPIWSLYS